MLALLAVWLRFSHVRLCATIWTVACQFPLPMEFCRQEHWSGLLLGSQNRKKESRMAVAKRQGREQPVKIEQRKVRVLQPCVPGTNSLRRTMQIVERSLLHWGPKAESPLSQRLRPVFVKTLCTLSVCAQTHLPKLPETGLNKGKERYNQSQPMIHVPFAQVVQFSRSVMSDSLRPHELQHARPACPSPTPGVYPYSCPLSR